MPSRIAATAADMPLFYQSFNSYAQAIAVKTAAHGLRVSLLPEIWGAFADGIQKTPPKPAVPGPEPDCVPLLSRLTVTTAANTQGY